jgi:hypothetical protein
MTQLSVLASGLRAVIALSIFGVCSSPAMAEISALVGGDVVSGDQATIALDTNVPQAFSYARPSAGNNVATAYFNWHLFCTPISAAGSSVTLNPRYQLEPSVGSDVWKFPSIPVRNLVYKGTGLQNEGALGLTIDSASTAGLPGSRCLSALPGSSFEPWTANLGLFSHNFGDYVGATGASAPPPQDPPSGPHQNIKVTAQAFPGFPGKLVSVVKVEMQLDATNPSQTGVVLVDAYNSAALSPATGTNSEKATWCLLRPDWIEGTVPPANLCDDASIHFPGTGKDMGAFVSRAMGFQANPPGPWYVLVSRELNGAGVATAGTPVQGFAALRISGGLVGVPEESQDWYTDDSVWYQY